MQRLHSELAGVAEAEGRAYLTNWKGQLSLNKSQGAQQQPADGSPAEPQSVRASLSSPLLNKPRHFTHQTFLLIVGNSQPDGHPLGWAKIMRLLRGVMGCVFFFGVNAALKSCIPFDSTNVDSSQATQLLWPGLPSAFPVTQSWPFIDTVVCRSSA